MVASDELRLGAEELVGYEQLRAARLGESSTGRLGEVLLLRRGLCAWARAWQATQPQATSAATRSTAARPAPGSPQIIGVLAQMALGCLSEG